MEWRRHDDATGKPGESGHVPVMGPVNVDLPFRRQEMKRREFEIADRIYSPAVAAIGSHVVVHHLLASDRLGQQILHLEAARGSGFKHGSFVRKRRPGRGADGGILLFEQFLRLG